MNVKGSGGADRPVLTATVNRLSKAGLKLHYELFRQNMRKEFLAARKVRHCSKPLRYGFDPKWPICPPLSSPPLVHRETSSGCPETQIMLNPTHNYDFS